MKNKFLIGLLCMSLFFSCEESFKELNYNPNAVTSAELAPPSTLILGTMLANVSINASHLQRISGMWTGQYRGHIANYLGLYNYDMSSSESVGSWRNLYNGVILQNREIIKYYSENALDTEGRLILGIIKVIEANAIGTGTSIWGDIPYSEAVSGDPYKDPKFDKQSEVYQAMQVLLDQAIAIFEDPLTGNSLREDIHFGGDKAKWKETAYTLKARYYLHTKQYGLAYDNALKGISTPENSMRYYPTTTYGAQNTLYTFLSNNFGYMTSRDTFCRDLLTLNSLSPHSRRNAKTSEIARRNYLFAGVYYASASKRFINGELTELNLVTYQENLLILAETGARTISMAEGLTHLNAVRAFNLTPDAFDREGFRKYDPYVLEDFEFGGMENEENVIAPDRALLREIIEERYVSGFGTFIPWNDARRLRKSDADLMVKFPFNTNKTTMHPQRLIISQYEINANPNAPTGLTIFDITEVNQ